MQFILTILFLFTTLNIADETTIVDTYHQQAQDDIRAIFEQEVHCMSENIIYEAGNQTIRGKIAVAQVTLNRLNSGKFSNTLCKVIYQPHQYSWTMMTNRPKYDIIDYKEAYVIALNVMSHKVALPELKNALYYHATYVHPVWRHDMVKVAQIEKHIFYKEN